LFLWGKAFLTNIESDYNFAVADSSPFFKSKRVGCEEVQVKLMMAMKEDSRVSSLLVGMIRVSLLQFILSPSIYLRQMI
jgi:hypothetical protein